jgi:hypothetical protein
VTLCLFQVQGPTYCTADRRIHEDRASEPLDRGPYFDVSASRNVTALVGKTATLNCRVRNLGDRTVSEISLLSLVYSTHSCATAASVRDTFRLLAVTF